MSVSVHTHPSAGLAFSMDSGLRRNATVMVVTSGYSDPSVTPNHLPPKFDHLD
ncbi:hypothetical protein N8D56_10465 [Devosia sp. A8/3-2]|nr:hypothetical protein N8D56_10465 [Devosia sp. A8/3-2]